MRTVIVTAIGSFSTDIVIKRHRENGMWITGCDVYSGEWVAGAGNVNAFCQVPYTSDTDRYIETMLPIYQREGVKAIIPLTDTETDVFNLHRRGFGGVDAALYMSNKACIDLYHDKVELCRYLKEHMEETVIPTVRLEDADLDKISYPAVYKPRNGRSNQDLRLVGSRHEMEGFLGETGPADYIVRPMMEGNVVAVNVVRSPEQSTCAAVCRRGLLRTLNGVGTSMLVFRNRQLKEWCRAIARLSGVRGCVDMEFIEDRDGVCHMLECSPRFSGRVEFSCLVGYDCATNHLRCFEDRGIGRDDRIKSMYIVRKYKGYITRVE